MSNAKLYYGTFVSNPKIFKNKIKKKIPSALYKKIQRFIPVTCVDLIVTSGQQFLLVKRRYPPEEGRWFFPGGRILKNELAKETAKRKLKKETGLIGSQFNLIGFYEYLSEDSRFKGINTHTPCLVFIARVNRKKKVKLDFQSLDFKWFSKIEKDFHPYLKKFLKIAGFN